MTKLCTIDYLADHLDAIPTLARWHDDEWLAVTPHLSIDDRIAGFRARAQRGLIPTGFVALVDDRVVGLACLVECDQDTHAHLTPWLATVLVAPDQRGRGIGSALTERATEEAQVLGFKFLYLLTLDKQSFYARLGWSFLDSAVHAGLPATVMVKELGKPMSNE